MSTQTHLPPNWEHRLAVLLGVPAQGIAAAMQLFDAWARAEGGTARWNPLNTTLQLPGSWVYNSVGVRNYAYATQGVAATGATLANGLYDGLLGALQSGKYSAVELAQQHEADISRWGTNPQLIVSILEEERAS